MHCTFWFCSYFLLIAGATNTTTDNPSTLPIVVASYLLTGSLSEGYRGGGGGGGGLSDHLAIIFLVNIPIKAPCKFRHVITLKISNINITDFRDNILNSHLIKHPHTTASSLSHQYFNSLLNILDKHSPMKWKVAPLHPDKGFV